MDKNYNFEKFKKDLDNGYQVYFTYIKNRYLLFKTTDNCYTQKLLTENEKNPHPKYNVITLKMVKETFTYMEDIEYKV